MAEDTSQLRADIAERVVRALHVIGEDLGGKAQRIAPLEEGTLRGSMTVVLIINGVRYDGAGALFEAIATARSLAHRGVPWRADVEVAFNTIYAARQHEELEWHHEAGQAKYLEQPFRENLSRYGGVLEKAASA